MVGDITSIKKVKLLNGQKSNIFVQGSKYLQIIANIGSIRIILGEGVFELSSHQMIFLPNEAESIVEANLDTSIYVISWKGLDDICKSIRDDLKSYNVISYIHKHITNDSLHEITISPPPINHKLPVKKELRLLFSTYDYFHKFHQDLRKDELEKLYQIKEKEFLIIMSLSYSKKELLSFVFNEITLDDESKFKAFIHINQHSIFHVKDFANQYNCSVSTFQRKFNKYFGVNPSNWLLQNRIKNLKHFLISSSLTLKEITEQLQFSSQAHMSSFCKKHLGKSPSEIREENLLR